jgi:general L-amino acid transport system permease protein
MQDPTPFTRSSMLEPRPAPDMSSGSIKWMRDNLFSSPLNIILTLLGLWLVYAVVSGSLPWLLHSVWVADSLGECRKIIEARFGPGTDGACWAVIRERWHQFIFGFYPPELYWRPVLVFVLMFVAMAPVLYTTLPSKMLWFTALYPFLAVWLLWGGSFWAPLAAVLGFVLMGVIFLRLSGRLGVPVAAGVGVIAASVYWLFLDDSLISALKAITPLAIETVDSDQFGGFLLAFVIGVSAISMSLPLGILLALGRQSDMMIVKTLSVGFIEFIRGVPLITLLFTASLLLQYFLPPNTNFDLILRVIILVTLFAAAYIAEVIRGGLAALPRGQYEAADALGLDYWQAQRLIILPQALKISIPGIVSSFIGLFKDTTLVAFVGLLDPLKGITTIVRADINWKGIYWEPYIFVGAIFFIFCFGMSRYSMYLERKLKTDHR